MQKTWTGFFEDLLAILRDLDIDCPALGDKVAVLAHKYLDAPLVYIEIWDWDKKRLLCYTCHGFSCPSPPSSISETKLGDLINLAEPVKNAPAENLPVFSRLSESIGSVLVYPVSIEGETKGAVCVAKRIGEPGFTADDEVELGFISVVIKFISHHRLMRERATRLFESFNTLYSVFPAVAEAILSDKDPDEVIVFLTESLRRHFDADHAAFIKFQNGGVKVLYDVGVDFDTSKFSPKTGLVGKILEHREPVLIKDFKEFVKRQGIRPEDVPCDVNKLSSGIGVPVKLNGEVVGVVLFGKGVSKAPFDEFDFEAVKIFQSLFSVTLKISKIKEEREKQKALISRAQRFEALGILAGGIAHDFNNIINIILALSEISKFELQKENPNKDQVISNLEAIIEQGKSASNLVKQILDFTRKGAESEQLIDLKPFLKELVKLFIRTVRADIFFKLRFSEDEYYYIKADPSAIQQVIMNMVVNAVDAMPNGGEIRIKLRKEDVRHERITTLKPGRYVVVDIEDTGVGIPKEILDRIFDPFFTTKPEGTGLGLAQAYGIIKNLSGEILVESEPGKGTKFSVYIPEAETREGSPGASDDSLSRRPKLSESKILVVDDKKKLADTISHFLSSVGCRTDVAYSFSEAKNKLEEKEFDIILTDVVLPDGNGLDLVKLAKNLRTSIKAVVMSGYKPSDIRLSEIQAHAEAFIPKPFTMTELLSVLKNLMEGKS